MVGGFSYYMIMENKGLVSIIIPAYNQEVLVEKCIRSALNQTYKNIEVVVVDDGSTDKTGRICDKLAQEDNRLVVVHQQNTGIGGAYNKCLDTATGDYVMSVDSDDYIAPEMVERLLSAMFKFDADISQCGRYHFNDINGIPITEQNDEYKCFTNKEILHEFFYDGVTGRNTEARLYKMSLWNGVRCPVGRQIVDVVTAPKLLVQCKKYVYLTGKYYYVYLSPNSMSRGVLSESRWDDYLYANKFFEDFINNNCPEYIDYISYRHVKGSVDLTMAIKSNNSLNDPKEALKFLKKDFNTFYNDFMKTKYPSIIPKSLGRKISIYKTSPALFVFLLCYVRPFLNRFRSKIVHK